MQLDVPHRADGEMRKQLADAHDVRSRLVGILVLGYFVRDDDRVSAHCAEAVSELFRAVIRHVLLRKWEKRSVLSLRKRRDNKLAMLARYGGAFAISTVLHLA